MVLNSDHIILQAFQYFVLRKYKDKDSCYRVFIPCEFLNNGFLDSSEYFIPNFLHSFSQIILEMPFIFHILFFLTIILYVCCSLVTKLSLTLCDPMDCSLPGSYVHGILQTRILEWVAIPFFGGSFQSKDWNWVSCIGRQILCSLSHQGSPQFCLKIISFLNILLLVFLILTVSCFIFQ